MLHRPQVAEEEEVEAERKRVAAATAQAHKEQQEQEQRAAERDKADAQSKQQVAEAQQVCWDLALMSLALSCCVDHLLHVLLSWHMLTLPSVDVGKNRGCSIRAPPIPVALLTHLMSLLSTAEEKKGNQAEPRKPLARDRRHI